MRLGAVLVTWNARQPAGGPLLDGCSAALTHDDGRREWFGGVCLRLPRSTRAATVGVLGRRGPNPYRWRHPLRRARNWLRWVRAGRPAAVAASSIRIARLDADGNVVGESQPVHLLSRIEFRADEWSTSSSSTSSSSASPGAPTGSPPPRCHQRPLWDFGVSCIDCEQP